MKIELIKWVDTFGCAQGWEFEDEIERKVTTVSSVGFVREETEKYVLLIPHISDAERKQVAGCICIPRKQIVERVELVKEEKTSKRSTTEASKDSTTVPEKVMDAEDYLRYRQQRDTVKPILIISGEELQEAKKFKTESHE